MRTRGRIRSAALGLACLLPLAGCGEEPDRVAAPPGGGNVTAPPGEVHLAPGPAFPRTLAVENPYEGDPRAVDEGERLYTWYNCGGCHGALGGGGMGPPLRDADWIYGGDAVSVFQSIMQGRPEGMPTWHGKIPDDQAWKIVAYVRSLRDGGHEPALTPPEGRVPAPGGAYGNQPGSQ